MYFFSDYERNGKTRSVKQTKGGYIMNTKYACFAIPSSVRLTFYPKSVSGTLCHMHLRSSQKGASLSLKMLIGDVALLSYMVKAFKIKGFPLKH